LSAARNILLIARRELMAMVGTMTGWVILAAVLGVDGLLFNAYALEGIRRSADVLTRFLYFSSGTTMVAAIFLSMRLLAEERQAGTLPLLYASPVQDVEIVLGKFVAGLTFLCGLTLLTAYMPLLILVHGKVSFGHLVAGYLGLFLLASACMALGTFASALARTQIVAGILGGALLVALLVAWQLSRVAEPPIARHIAPKALHKHQLVPNE
jgi:ABC-2 type transport system permease protein